MHTNTTKGRNIKRRTDVWMDDEGACARAVMSGGIHSTQTVVYNVGYYI